MGSNILASMELESELRVALEKQVNKSLKQQQTFTRFTYLVVANTLPPTFSLTQSLRVIPSGDGAEDVLRNVKSGTSDSLEGAEGMARVLWEGVGVEGSEGPPFSMALCDAAYRKTTDLYVK